MIVTYGSRKLDQFKLPPAVAVKYAGDINTLINKGVTRRERKWIAACIIMGQPFNLGGRWRV